MSDDTSKAGQADRIRINVRQAHERSYWCAAFGVTKACLELAVKEVGPMVEDVRNYLIEKIRNAK